VNKLKATEGWGFSKLNMHEGYCIFPTGKNAPLCRKGASGTRYAYKAVHEDLVCPECLTKALCGTHYTVEAKIVKAEQKEEPETTGSLKRVQDQLEKLRLDRGHKQRHGFSIERDEESIALLEEYEGILNIKKVVTPESGLSPKETSPKGESYRDRVQPPLRLPSRQTPPGRERRTSPKETSPKGALFPA